jgi:AcrR family transcriptional regulator
MTDHESPPIDHHGPEANHRLPGRPRDPETDRAILRAAVEVLSEVGLQGITVNAVAERAGVARGTIYLRWATREALLGAVARAAGGGFPYQLTGDIDRDIRVGSDYGRKVVTGGHFVAVMPELVSALLSNPPQMTFDDLAPNRTRFAEVYRASATAQGFRDVDPHLAFDLLLGAQFMHILATGKPPSRAYVDAMAEAIVAGLRVKAGHETPDTNGSKR